MLASKFLVNFNEKCSQEEPAWTPTMGHFRDTHCPVIPYPFDTHGASLARPQPGGPASVSASLVSGAFTIKPKVAGPSLVFLPNTQRDIRIFRWYFWSQYVLHNVCRSICQPGKWNHGFLHVSTYGDSLHAYTALSSF